MQKITVDVIGAGRWGPNLVRAFSDLPQTAVGRLHDRDARRAMELQKKFPGVEVAESYDAILEGDADAVVIATPVESHAALVEGALLAGKHVFVEKPFCSTSEAGRRLVALARQKGLCIHVGHVFLFNPSVIKVKELIAEGLLGQVQYMEARRTNLGPVREDVNAIWDLASHDYSIFAYWLGRWPTRVNASAFVALKGGVADLGFSNLIFDNRTYAASHVSWLSPLKVRQITVVGEKRMLVWDDIDLTRPIQVFDSSITRTEEAYSDSFGSHRLTYLRGDIQIPFVEGGQPLNLECQHFIDCLRNGTASRSDGEFGNRVVELLEASDRSIAKSGAFVDVRDGESGQSGV